MDFEGRNWKVIIGISHYYLTEKEARFYLDAKKKKQEWVEFPNGLVLSTNFLALVPPEVSKITQLIDDGLIEPVKRKYIPSKVLEKKWQEEGKDLPMPTSLASQQDDKWAEKRERITKAKEEQERQRKLAEEEQERQDDSNIKHQQQNEEAAERENNNNIERNE